MIKLNSDQLRAVSLPGDPRQRMHLRYLHEPTAEVRLDATDRADLRDALDGMREVYLDATKHGLRVTPYDTDAEAQPADVIVGQRFAAKLLLALLDALPRGPLAIVWRRRMDPITMHAVEGPAGWRDAVAMPQRSCTLEGFMGTPRPGCPCRDCTAGRRWGWR